MRESRTSHATRTTCPKMTERTTLCRTSAASHGRRATSSNPKAFAVCTSIILALALTASQAGAFVVMNSKNTPSLQSIGNPPRHSDSAALFLASTLNRKTDTTNGASSTERKSVTPPAQRSTTNMDSSPKSSSSSSTSTATTSSLQSRVANSGLASAAAVATAAVNAAVSMKSIEAPDVTKSYIARGNTLKKDGVDTQGKSNNALDQDGLPLVYDKDLIEAYWRKERGALNRRWSEFVGKAVPFLSKLITLYIRDGSIREEEIPELSRQARVDLQDLGPTFIKAGQMMSVRPDVLPPATLDELAKLQDSVIPFSTDVALEQLESELGGPWQNFFSSITPEPVAAASLAQVYLATLRDANQTRVAVKVQRPNVLGTVSKDLYVLRRAAEVWQGLVERFAPQQKTNYVGLLNEWAVGFYTELDFSNEAQNQKRLRQLLLDYNITSVTVPKVFDELCTRRVLVSEWMNGIKLSQCTTEQIAKVTPAAQEAFLTQLFEVGFFHSDPHPGNLIYLDKPTPEGARLALIDCGLMATIDPKDRDNMISALIHLANKDYPALVDDFINLGILPADSNRAAIIPLMDKALSPYVKGGGAKKYEEELRKLYGMEDGTSMQSQVGGFQAMTQDALTVLNDIPFSIPPYFALLGRAIVTLEGVALSGDPNYAIIRSSYPFVARKLLREGRPEIQKALQEVLYSSSASGDMEGVSRGFKLTRLLALLNNAAGAGGVSQPGAAFVDLDTIPEDGGLTLAEGFKYLLSDKAAGLRTLLEREVDTVVDVLSRQIFRRAMSEALVALTPPRPPSVPFLGDVFPQPPALDEIPLPILLPSAEAGSGAFVSSRPSVGLLTLKEFTDIVAPKLSQDEDVFSIGLAEVGGEFLGKDIGDLMKGERVLSPQSIQIFIQALRSGVLGRRDLVSSSAVDGVLQFVDTSLQRSRRRSISSDGEQDLLSDVLLSLDDSERDRLDEIIQELTRRAIERLVRRLASVERIL